MGIIKLVKKRNAPFLPLFGLLFVLTVLFFLKTVGQIDTDFGWHVQIGEIILSSGLPKTDPFSYTMSSFPFIDHEYLSNIVLYVLSNVPFFLPFIFSFIAVLSFLFAIIRTFNKYLFGVYFFSAAAVMPAFGVRLQVLSWLFVSVLLFLFFDDNKWKKFKYFIPPVFILWVNMHGSIGLGVFLLVLFLLFKTIQDKKLKLTDIFVVALSIFATFINPYGWRIWAEVFSQAFDAGLRFSVMEWLPALLVFNFATLVLFSLSFVFVFKYRKKLTITKIGIYFFLLFLGLSSVRHIPFWVIVNLYILPDLLRYFWKDFRKDKIFMQRLIFFSRIFTLSSFILCFVYLIFFWAAFSYLETDFYPQKAVMYLQKNIPDKQIFSSYEWGGYLDWKLPQKKVFIDGRMPSWKKNAPKNESNNALEDYENAIASVSKRRILFKKYNIGVVLWPIEKKNKKNSFLSSLKKDKWKEVYKDSVSVILKNF